MSINNEMEKISLREYMEKYPGGIGVNYAANLLMPVAQQLRDMHNSGYIHLEVSPNSIFVGQDGSVLYGTTSVPANRCVGGFASPEIYQGGPFGYYSDVYSFCAVLSYVAFGRPGADWIVADQSNAGFCELLRRGMTRDVASRMASMQEVIMLLSPYKAMPVFAAQETTAQEMPAQETPVQEMPAQETPVQEMPAQEMPAQEMPAAEKKKKSKMPVWLLITISAAALVLILVGAYFGCYFIARSNAQDGDFDGAESLLLIPQITNIHDSDLVAYVDAGQKLAEGKYGEAKAAFAKLPGYMNADELAKEADYQHAIQYADGNSFDNAIAIMETLSKTKYKDSADKLLEFQYKKGAYLLDEKANYAEADEIFAQLAQKNYDGAEEMRKETQLRWANSMIEKKEYIEAYNKLNAIADYPAAAEALETVKEKIYDAGKALYEAEMYKEAKEQFTYISGYENSDKYIILIDAHRVNEYTISVEMIDNLISIFDFEDASDLLLSNQYIGELFLAGEWRADEYYFTMKKGGDISYNLPWFEYGDYYVLRDGQILLFPRYNEDDTKALFKITAITPDCIEVYCYQDRETYTLYRE